MSKHNYPAMSRRTEKDIVGDYIDQNNKAYALENARRLNEFTNDLLERLEKSWKKESELAEIFKRLESIENRLSSLESKNTSILPTLNIPTSHYPHTPMLPSPMLPSPIPPSPWWSILSTTSYTNTDNEKSSS